MSNELPVARQGYLWVKITESQDSKEEPVADEGFRQSSQKAASALTATAALSVAVALEPPRRRWCVLSAAGALMGYASPPADASEVPSGRCDVAGALLEDLGGAGDRLSRRLVLGGRRGGIFLETERNRTRCH